MIIIGEKINGAVPSVAKAIENRDEAFIRDLAVRQAQYGASYIDVCASTSPSVERETLKWLMDIVQDATDVPLSIDSSDPNAIIDVLPHAKKPGLINSASDEGGKCEILFPAIADTEWSCIALTCDNNGIPTDPDVKFKIAQTIAEKAQKYGLDFGRLFLDPLVNSIATVPEAMLSFMKTTRDIKAAFPDVHITSGLSNISFGMPLRKSINQSFLVLAVGAGMDSAIMDPTSADMRAALYTTEMLLGIDEYCVEFLGAYREGIIGPPKA
ncbi:MAG: methyltetrahydrofolate cobalamin methyltransferase [Clostridiales Family XIII bacterium]|jgi:5-methyltetrahydrofolate--homocysteine methyltransferase|nr:methyltetrahydrofolate cobalamin methyltransferase [Clostridiales Family XIII bacterium]